MDSYTIAQLAYVFAEHARVLGMQAQNMKLQAVGEPMAYTKDDFEASAYQLEDIAIRTLNGV